MYVHVSPWFVFITHALTSIIVHLHDADAPQLRHVAGLALRGAVPMAQRAARVPAPGQQLRSRQACVMRCSMQKPLVPEQKTSLREMRCVLCTAVAPTLCSFDVQDAVALSYQSKMPQSTATAAHVLCVADASPPDSHQAPGSPTTVASLKL